MMDTVKTSILIPAHNEAAYLPACLDAVLASDAQDIEVIVIANGCTDNTADIARGYEAHVAAKGWRLVVLDLAEGGKLNAWNKGEDAASGAVLIYVDADVCVQPDLIAQIAAVLSTDAPRYASGVPHVTLNGKDALTRHFTRFWLTTPFMVQGVPGFGVFAMNRAGRARWGAWPDIISDDTFARLNFTPEERLRVAGRYDWPMIEGFTRLVQVRRRQNIGVAEIADRYPGLMKNDDTYDQAQPLWKRAVADPLAFGAYITVRLAVRLPILRTKNRWARGR